MTAARERTTVRPTIFGVVVVAVLVVTFALGLAVADPSVAGLVWSGLAAAAVLGAAWPMVTVRTVGLRIVAAPTDLIVGQLSSLEIELSGRASGLTLRCTGSPLLVADVVSPGVTRIPIEVAARGAYRSIRVDVGSDAPFGIGVALRRRTLELPRQLLVGPASVAVDAPVGPLVGEQTDTAPRGVSMSGESVRAVRPYVSGDPSHLVHWPTTARVGTLVVRELEPPVATGLAIVVDLTAPHGIRPSPLTSPPTGSVVQKAPVRALSASQNGRGGSGEGDGGSGEGIGLGAFLAVEHAAARAAGAAELALAQGARVMLCTVESAGPVVDEVADLLGVRRRLALAVDGPPAAAPEGWPVMVIEAGPT